MQTVRQQVIPHLQSHCELVVRPGDRVKSCEKLNKLSCLVEGRIRTGQAKSRGRQLIYWGALTVGVPDLQFVLAQAKRSYGERLNFGHSAGTTGALVAMTLKIRNRGSGA